MLAGVMSCPEAVPSGSTGNRALHFVGLLARTASSPSRKLHIPIQGPSSTSLTKAQKVSAPALAGQAEEGERRILSKSSSRDWSRAVTRVNGDQNVSSAYWLGACCGAHIVAKLPGEEAGLHRVGGGKLFLYNSSFCHLSDHEWAVLSFPFIFSLHCQKAMPCSLQCRMILL